MMRPLSVREATRADMDELLALREQVFCGEQGVSPEAERDGLDGDALHLVVRRRGAVIGTCRLLIEGAAARLGRMAVAPQHRGHGIGTALLREAERAAAAQGATRIALHAQVAAQRLYARSGYTASGPAFLEEGIEHVAMEKTLA